MNTTNRTELPGELHDISPIDLFAAPDVEPVNIDPDDSIDW